MVLNEGSVCCDKCEGEGDIILNEIGDWEECDKCGGDGFL
tara:strand:- start:300 stop:419 length:120 start_codon:yes stop_codon:yes gene_type:complete